MKPNKDGCQTNIAPAGFGFAGAKFASLGRFIELLNSTLCHGFYDIVILNYFI